MMEVVVYLDGNVACASTELAPYHVFVASCSAEPCLSLCNQSFRLTVTNCNERRSAWLNWLYQHVCMDDCLPTRAKLYVMLWRSVTAPLTLLCKLLRLCMFSSKCHFGVALLVLMSQSTRAFWENIASKTSVDKMLGFANMAI